MEFTALRSIIDQVQPGTKLRLTFKQANGRPRPNHHGGSRYFIDDSMVATLSYFGLMAGQNLIIDEMSLFLVRAVVQSKYWDSDQNRTFTVTIPEEFDRGWFEKRLCDGLEKVEIL
jgi:hypothetical protein